jgi:beta-N-acetylhexosaminidase
MGAATELLWAGFVGIDPQDVPPDFPKTGRSPGGRVIFGRNLDPDPATGPELCHRLIRELRVRAASDYPLAVAIDQEGGTVSRLRVWTGATPTLRQIWTSGGAEACARWGRLWGQGLRLLGIDVDFAPCADLTSTGLGDRSAGPEPLEVACAAGAILSGLESAGVRGCLKHFPGLGGTGLDSHKGLPVLEDSAQIARNLGPFRALAHEERLVMVAHLRTPFTQGLPASLHRGSVTGNPWGIRGWWLPDDLEMGGCGDWPWPDRIRLCLEAGHQALLVCQTPAGIRACAEAAEALPESLWGPALERFRALRAQLKPLEGPFDRVAWDAWLGELKASAEELMAEDQNK